MSRPSRPRPGRPSTTSRTGVWIWLTIAGLGLTVVGGLGAAAYHTARAARYDETTLCNVDGPAAVTAILIDATDGLNSVQRRAVLNRLNRINRTLVANERVDVFEISAGADALVPTFSMCRPVSASETSSLTGNKRVAQARFDATFKPKLEASLVKLLDRQPSDSSPIMEAIQAAVVASFQAPDVPEAAPKRLIVVSDMLQHSASVSQYGAVPDFFEFRETPAFELMSTDLDGANVTVLYLKRPSAAQVQGRRHADFWMEWFESLGADDANSIPIEG